MESGWSSYLSFSELFWLLYPIVTPSKRCVFLLPPWLNWRRLEMDIFLQFTKTQTISIFYSLLFIFNIKSHVMEYSILCLSLQEIILEKTVLTKISDVSGKCLIMVSEDSNGTPSSHMRSVRLFNQSTWSLWAVFIDPFPAPMQGEYKISSCYQFCYYANMNYSVR